MLKISSRYFSTFFQHDLETDRDGKLEANCELGSKKICRRKKVPILGQKFLHIEKSRFIVRGNKPMVGMTVAVAVAIEEASK